MHGGSNNAYKGTFLLTLWFVHWSETEQQLESELVKPGKAYLGGHKIILFGLQYYTLYSMLFKIPNHCLATLLRMCWKCVNQLIELLQLLIDPGIAYLNAGFVITLQMLTDKPQTN